MKGSLIRRGDIPPSYLWNTQRPLIGVKHFYDILPVFIQRLFIIRRSDHRYRIEQEKGVVKFERGGVFIQFRREIYGKECLLGVGKRGHHVRPDLRVLKRLCISICNRKRFFQGIVPVTLR